MHLVATFVILAMTIVPAGAASRTACRRACAPLVDSCVDRNQDLGDFRRLCQAGIVKRCRTSGVAICTVCGDGTAQDREACDARDLKGKTCRTEGFAGGTLTCSDGCRLDTSRCFATRFVDNGDGTITDNKTGLQWEKKFGGSDGTRAVLATFTLSATPGLLDGTAYSTFLLQWFKDDPNNELACLGGHCDWRLPTSSELSGIIDEHAPGCGLGTLPCIDPIFGPTAPGLYWTDSIFFAPLGRLNHYMVDFGVGLSGFTTEDGSESHYVRAVRGETRIDDGRGVVAWGD
jgi:hypothetical protein